jgi:hypothetical protein
MDKGSGMYRPFFTDFLSTKPGFEGERRNLMATYVNSMTWWNEHVFPARLLFERFTSLTLPSSHKNTCFAGVL